MSPARIQRKRTKGWRMPEGAVYVGRPSRWGNPYHDQFSLLGNLSLFRHYVNVKARLAPDWLAPLKGRDLACWCPFDRPCHADVLLELANQ